MEAKDVIRYFDLFDYPLKKEEIEVFGLKNFNLSNYPEILFENDYFFLKGRRKIIPIRLEREKNAKKLWKKTYFYLNFLRFLPFLKMVAVCNTLAFNNPAEKSDIDLFIVTAKNRLWISRILVTFFLQILGVRRYGKKISGRFCLSFWCTEDAVNLEDIQIKPLDPYLAFWCLTLTPVLDNAFYLKFKNLNRKWINKIYQLDFPSNQKKTFSTNAIVMKIEKCLKGKFGDWLEQKTEKLLRPRAEKKAKNTGNKASIIISKNMLKFHNHDKRQEIYEKWRNSID